VYDKTTIFRKYECPLVFLPSGKKDPKFVSNPWGNGLHPTNVRYEPAVYAVTPKSVSKDSTCIAMTRALGDFYAHQFGLTNIPDISVKRVPASSSYQLHIGSDGIWDCWKFGDYHDFVKSLVTKGKDVQEVCDIVLDESILRARTNFGPKHFDDASLVILAFPSPSGGRVDASPSPSPSPFSPAPSQAPAAPAPGAAAAASPSASAPSAASPAAAAGRAVGGGASPMAVSMESPAGM